jgi:hypothetical protein
VPYPWDTGDLDRNWRGYFIPGTSILRNRVGAQTVDGLRDAENDLVETRVIELREAPDLLGDRSYDLAYLKAIHRQLFQDVYDWAGDVRTVGIEKGDESFCPPGSIGQPMDHVAAKIHRLRQLRAVPVRVYPGPMSAPEESCQSKLIQLLAWHPNLTRHLTSGGTGVVRGKLSWCAFRLRLPINSFRRRLLVTLR